MDKEHNSSPEEMLTQTIQHTPDTSKMEITNPQQLDDNPIDENIAMPNVKQNEPPVAKEPNDKDMEDAQTFNHAKNTALLEKYVQSK